MLFACELLGGSLLPPFSLLLFPGSAASALQDFARIPHPPLVRRVARHALAFVFRTVLVAT